MSLNLGGGGFSLPSPPIAYLTLRAIVNQLLAGLDLPWDLIASYAVPHGIG